MNFTGLGSFLGAGTDPVYDPVMVHGLQVTEQAITHVTNDLPSARPRELSFSSARNMELWADWVRASLFLTEFLRDLDWTVDSRTRTVALRHGAATFCTFQRPTMTAFRQQLKIMKPYMDQRPDRAPEILTQLGFPTPYFMMLLGLQSAPNRFSLELITITQVLTAHAAMVFKHHLACRRPDRIGAEVMPIIPTPAHASFPSAHAAEAFAVAEVLKYLIRQRRPHYPDIQKRHALLGKLAERIAVNRTVAGVHFPIDSWAGAILGRAIGQIIVAKCGAATRVDRYRYSAKGRRDFFLNEFDMRHNPRYGVFKMRRPFRVRSRPLFVWLWGKASKELDLSQ